MTSGRLLSWLAWCGAALLAAWLYAPGLAGPPLLDDRANLSVLEEIDDNPGYLVDVVTGNHASSVGRPVAMLSFAVEKLCCDRGLAGFKRTNLLLHISCSLLLLLLARTLFAYLQLPAADVLAALVAAAWLLSPLYVSTVLYTVQRMAQLSTLFVLLGLFAYSRWRVDLIAGRPRHWLLLAVAGCAVTGFYAKENALLLLPLIVVVECYVFRFCGRDGVLLVRARLYTLAAAAVAALGLLFLAWWWPELYTGSYRLRDFTLPERVLTEARVLWDYAAQLVSPEVRRMGVFHDDYVKSTGLANPVTTTWSVAGWMLVILAGIAGVYWPVLGRVVFGLVFFLVGHALESTVFALELYFEHRNYLPGAGLFLLAGLLVGEFLRRFPQAHAALLSLLALLLLLLALRTSSQAMVWSNAYLLHMDAVNAHPRSVRANTEYASYLARVGFLEQALAYSRRAEELQPGLPVGAGAARELVLYCLANRALPAHLPGDFVLAKGDILLRGVGDALQVLVELIENGGCPALDAGALADRFAAIYLRQPFAEVPSTQVFLVLALLENHLQQPQRAMAYTSRLLARGTDRPQVYLMHLNFAVTLGDLAAADEMNAWLRAADAAGRLDRQQRDTWQLHLRE